jgi:hypothetical protein
MSNAAPAAAIGWHHSVVRRRIDELRRSALLPCEAGIRPAGELAGLTLAAARRPASETPSFTARSSMGVSGFPGVQGGP